MGLWLVRQIEPANKQVVVKNMIGTSSARIFKESPAWMVGFLARSGEGEQVSYFKVPLLSTLRGPLCTTQGLRVSGRIRVGSRLLRT